MSEFKIGDIVLVKELEWESAYFSDWISNSPLSIGKVVGVDKEMCGDYPVEVSSCIGRGAIYVFKEKELILINRENE